MNIWDPKQNWGAEPLRMPAITGADVLIFSECGRVIRRDEHNATDYRSHWLCLVKDGGHYSLLVKHGGGEERIPLGYAYRIKPVADAMVGMDSDSRYLTMYALFEVRKDTERATADKYRAAFVQGRLKKSRPRGGMVSVWIEEPTAPQ